MKLLALILTICLLMASAAAAQDDSAPDITFEYVSGTPIEGRITFDSLAFNRLIQRIDPPLGADRWIVELDSATGEFINVISAPVAAGNFKWHEVGFYSYGYSEPVTMLEAQTRLRSGEGVLVATLNAVPVETVR